MLTDQEVFDKIVGHLRRQNSKSLSGLIGGTCKYRGANGKMCAVGCLIPDNQYTRGLEFLAPDHDELRDILSQFTLNFPLLKTLQSIHDQEHVADWEKCFQEVAATFGLEYKPC